MTLLRRGCTLSAFAVFCLELTLAQISPSLRVADSSRSFPLNDTLLNRSDSVSRIVSYDTVAYPFRTVYSLPFLRDSATGESALAPVTDRSRVAPARDLIFGEGMVRSGSITRGIQIGTNRDASVVAGFRLQVSGAVAEDVHLNAALTDEHSPIQPEGTTQSLREVDKVSIDLTGRDFGLTLGDFVFEKSGDEAGSFGLVQRKLQGITGYGSTGELLSQNVRSTARAVAGSARGTYHSIPFSGRDGVQGPYRLSGKNGETYIVVVAGSEQVRVNGERMKRGEVEDYTIDYGTGEVTFTNKRLITSDSRIVVDFEYADRQFARSIVGGDVLLKTADRAFEMRFSALQESDDVDNPLGGTLDRASLDIISAAGADRLKASVSGVRDVGRDSTTGRGLGQYERIDTTVSGTVISIVRYAPGSTDAVYAVTFTPVNAVPPDSAGYDRVAGGEYRFVGLGEGSYMARSFLPVPRQQRNVSGALRLSPIEGLVLELEGTNGRLDSNRLSALDQAAGNSGAYDARVAYRTKELDLFGSSIGSLTLQASQRVIGDAFVSFGRVRPAEYERDWDIPAGTSSDERTQEVSATYAPVKQASLTVMRASQERSDGFAAVRNSVHATLTDSAAIRAGGSYERLERTTDDGRSSNWDRSHGTLSFSSAWGTPTIGVHSERREEWSSTASDSALTGSFRYLEIAPGYSVILMNGWSLAAQTQLRSEDSAVAGELFRSFDAVTAGVSSTFEAGPSLRANLDLQSRSVSFEERFRLRGNQDTRTTLIRSLIRSDLSRGAVRSEVFYEFSRQQSARLERAFVRVQPGSGQFHYTGDANGNGQADEAEFEQVRYDGDYVVILIPGETFVPVSVVRASGRLRLRPALAGLTGIMRRFSFETVARVEEKSRDVRSSHLALINLGSFLSPQNTIGGTQILTQDVHVDEHEQRLNVRFRVNEKRGLTQLVTTTESSYGNERSVRVRGRFDAATVFEVDAFAKRDRLLGDVSSYRVRDLTTTGASADVGYRLDREWEIGMVIGASRTRNMFPGSEGVADLNEQAVRGVYGIAGKGTVRAELRREDVTASSDVPGSSSVALPYEMTEGRGVGITWSFNLTADVQLTDLVQLSGTYAGRSERGGTLIHTARLEARAVF